MKISIIFILTIVSVALAIPKIRYDGFKVYKITPNNSAQVDALRELEKRNFGFNFWSQVTYAGRPVHIMVPPNLEHVFDDFVKLQNLTQETYIKNVQELIENESPKEKSARFGWDNYYRVDEVSK